MASPLDPLPEGSFGPYEAAHLLWRAGFGGTWEEIQALAARGLSQAVSSLLDFPASMEPAPDFVTLPDTGPDSRRTRRREERDKMDDLRSWWLGRMLNTRHPLEEKLTLFWHGHFATSFEDKIQVAYPSVHSPRCFPPSFAIPRCSSSSTTPSLSPSAQTKTSGVN
jgi:hypothetical protein